VHAIANGVKALLEAPGEPRRCFATPSATEAAVEEMLRFEPPLHLFTRYALEEVEIGGVALKRGDVIGLLLGSANRDEARWPDADRFDPARPPQANVAFGAGIHFCLGAPLARLEMQVALPILFERLPALTLAEPPRWRDSYHFHGLEALRVKW
jgi:cytochrome P450